MISSRGLLSPQCHPQVLSLLKIESDFREANMTHPDSRRYEGWVLVQVFPRGWGYYPHSLPQITALTSWHTRAETTSVWLNCYCVRRARRLRTQARNHFIFSLGGHWSDDCSIQTSLSCLLYFWEVFLEGIFSLFASWKITFIPSCFFGSLSNLKKASKNHWRWVEYSYYITII